jgi:hypothetical protein
MEQPEMKQQSPNFNQPLFTLTISDITETRDRQPTTLRMRWPVDEDTTRRLERLRRLALDSTGNFVEREDEQP